MLGRGYGITNFLINIAGTGGGVAPLVNTKSLAFDGVDDYMITEHAESVVMELIQIFNLVTLYLLLLHILQHQMALLVEYTKELQISFML